MFSRPVKPDFQRLRTALFRGEPDRVPTAEILVDPPIKNAFMGEKIDTLEKEVKFCIQAGYDHVTLNAGLWGAGNAPTVGQRGATTNTKEWAQEGEGLITSFDDFERFPWEDLRIDLSKFDEIGGIMPPGMKAIAYSGKIFMTTWMLMGFYTFSFALEDNEELVKEMFAKIGSIYVEGFERVCHYDTVGGLWIGDDLAFNVAPMINPKYLRKYVFPHYKKICNLAKQKGIPIIFHSDGNLWPVMDDLIACGFNALHPIEPLAMDINEVKAKVGNKLCIMGNIDLSYTLTRGTPQEVKAEVRKRIEDLAPGGGYVVSSSNSITYYVPIENYVAMLEAVFEYGKYPVTR